MAVVAGVADVAVAVQVLVVVVEVNLGPIICLPLCSSRILSIPRTIRSIDSS